MVLNWHHSRLDLYWIQSGVNLTPEFLQCRPTLNLQLSGKDQICLIQVYTRNVLIQVYAPTSDYDDEVVEAFYEDVSKAVEENKAKYTIVMGDLNAKVGERQPEEETILGKFGYGQRHKRGDMLLEFAA